MGIDQLMILEKIPGRWGFVRYVSQATIPEPWGTVVSIVYEILEFIIANVIASGVRGVGWIIYTIGSIIGSAIANQLISAIIGGSYAR